MYTYEYLNCKRCVNVEVFGHSALSKSCRIISNNWCFITLDN